MRPMSGKISSDLEHDLCRFRGERKGEEEEEEGAAGMPLFLSSLGVVSSPRLGGWLLISFLYDSQSALLKYAICSEQSEDDKCRNQSGKRSLNETDLRSLPPGESGFLPPPLFYDKLPQHGETAGRPGPRAVYTCTPLPINPT